MTPYRSDIIVCLSITEWSGVPHNSRHLMTEASRRGYRVLYVDPLGFRRPQFQRRDAAKLLRRVRRFSNPLSEVHDGIWRLAPLGIPYQNAQFGNLVNMALLGLQIRLALRRLSVRTALLWSYQPEFVMLRGRFAPRIYYRTDDYPSLPGTNTSLLRMWESRAVELADLCIGSAERYLADPFSQATRKLWLPNAIDASVFSSSNNFPDPIPAIGKPRVLMVGTFDFKTDVHLLRNVAMRRPDLQLVLAGDEKTSLQQLRELPNVHYFGVLPYEELPSLISHCDVGLVPLRLGQPSADASPGKVYQYLAMGVPVLCTPFVDPSRFDNHVTVAPGTGEAFSHAIDALMREDTHRKREARTDFALKQTWAARFDAIEAALRQPPSP